MTKPTPLSLGITLEDIFPLVAAPRDQVTVQILIRNSGKEPVDFPSSMDIAGILKPGNQGQKELNLGLSVSPMGTGRSFYFPLCSTAGASSVPGSMLTLTPGESLVIRCKGSLASGVDVGEQSTSIDAADVRVELTEDLIEDDRYAIKNSSERLASNNSFRVYWPFQIQRSAFPRSARRTEKP